MPSPDSTAQIDRQALDLVGAQTGLVKALGGFKKGFHHVPTGVDDYTQAFVAKIAAGDLEEEATELYTAIKRALGYKRREIALTVEGASAAITTRDFDLRLTYAQDVENPAAFVVEYVVSNIRAADVLHAEALQGALSHHFNEVRFHLARQIDLEAWVDAVEDLERDDFTLDYPPDCRRVALRPNGRDWALQLTETSVSLLSDRPASPGAILGILTEGEGIMHDSGLTGLLVG